MQAFDEAEVAFYALSYDEPDAIADFAAASDITYTMLSDPNSEVISAFGILNTTIPPDDHPWYGVPFPGTYVIDADGIITNKVFDRNFGTRPGPEELLAAALGAELHVDARPGSTEQLTVAVALDDRPLPVGVSRDIVAVFAVPEGKHLYGPPVPNGLVATTIEVDVGDGLMDLGLSTPPTSELALAGGDSPTLNAYEGNVTIRRRIAQTGRAVEKDDTGRWVTITGTVRWQSCDDNECDLPQEQKFSFRIPSGPRVPGDVGAAKGKVPAMHGEEHFARMVERRRSTRD